MRHARVLLTAILSVSLLASSAASAASSAPPPQPAQAGGWMALSMLNSAGAAVVGASGAAAGQSDAAPLPPAPDRFDDTTWMLIGSSIILLGLLALAVSKGDHEHNEVATSPF